MELKKIVVKSDTITIPERVLGRGTWAEFKQPEHVSHRFFITRIFDDGTEMTEYTNNEGEGLFVQLRNGGESQITGTSQFSVSSSTSKAAKAWFRRRYKKLLEETGAELKFDMDY